MAAIGIDVNHNAGLAVFGDMKHSTPEEAGKNAGNHYPS